MGMEIPMAKEDEAEGEEEQEQVVAAVLEGEQQEQVVAAVEEDEQQGRQQRARDEVRELRMLKSRPSILFVGPPAVGKRTLLNRLIARGRSVQATSTSGATCHGWTIDTKYYTANVCMWTARLGDPTLEDAASITSEFGNCEALVMVFDLSSANSLEQLQEFVTNGLELRNFEILLCVGNKADRVPEHFGHAEYRRKLQKRGESSNDPHPEFWDFGIDRTEGSSLLDGEVVSVEDRRRSCIQWCSDMGIEYIEACGINEVFDECMSIDDDLQGVARIRGALSAHMWPGLVMKDENESKDATPSSDRQQEEMTSDDDSDYYIEYELLSNGSAEPWEASGWEEDQWSFSPHLDEPAPQANGSLPTSMDSTPPNVQSGNQQGGNSVTSPVLETTEKSITGGPQCPQVQASHTETSSNGHVEHSVAVQNGHGEQEGLPTNTTGQHGQKSQELEDMEQLMEEMASMRLNMRSMSDQHRREMAAQLAMRMASMFKEDEGGESDLE